MQYKETYLFSDTKPERIFQILKAEGVFIGAPLGSFDEVLILGWYVVSILVEQDKNLHHLKATVTYQKESQDGRQRKTLESNRLP